MRVHVLGAGIVGLACADELLTRGHDVTVVDPSPGSGASAVAAGMLSPGGEAWFGEPDVHRLGAAGALLWPAYAARLGVPLHDRGTLVVGHDARDGHDVARQAEVLGALGVEVRVLAPAEVARLEPTLDRVERGLLLADRAVDPRAVVAALTRRLGGRVVAASPPERPDVTVLATGAALPGPWSGLVRGVRGEVVRLRTDDPPGLVVRGWVAGEPVYVVPRPDGEVVVGATLEEHPGPPVPTGGGVLRLLRAARALLPSLDRAELLACEARDRPATRDHLPAIGPTDDPHTFLAAGHFRHGVLLAPLTARLLADAVDGVDPDPAVDPRRLTRPDEGARPCT